MHGLALAITLTLPLTPSPPLTRTRTLTNPNPNTRYGPLRLPMLLSGWAEAARLGWQEERLAAPADHRRRYEPLFVLRRNSTADLPHHAPHQGPPHAHGTPADLKEEV